MERRRMRLFFFQAEDGIRDLYVTGVQTCALPISGGRAPPARARAPRRDRTGPDVDPARAPAGRGGAERGGAAGGGLRGARARALDPAGRAPARGRASPRRTRRFRARTGARAADAELRRA